MASVSTSISTPASTPASTPPSTSASSPVSALTPSTPGFNDEDFRFGKLFKCISVCGQESLLYMIEQVCNKHAIALDTNVKQFCRDVRKWSNGDMKNKFAIKDDRTRLNDTMLSKNFDISLASKILTIVFQNEMESLRFNYRDHIKELQGLRNQMCHKYGSFSKNESDSKAVIDNLKNSLQKLYMDVQTAFSLPANEVDVVIKRAHETIDAIWSTQYSLITLAEYLKMVEDFRNAKCFKMITEGQKELEKHYKGLRILNPCTWLDEEDYRNFKEAKVQKFKVDQIFTPLKLEGTDDVDLNDLLTVISLGYGVVPNALILKGLAGSGKTSLCRYLLYKWYTKDSSITTLKDFDLVFLIEIRRIRYKYLNQLLREGNMFNKTCQQFASHDIIPLLKEMKLLFIIDGYDECNAEAKNVVDEIFEKFGDQRIIVTTRPEFESDVTGIAIRFKVKSTLIDVCGFDDKNMRSFTQKVFDVIEVSGQKSREQSGKFLEYIDGRGKVLNDHLKLPLTLALLIYLWKESPDIINKVTSATTLYVELFKLCQKKLAERLCNQARTATNVNDLLKILDDLLISLGKRSWDSLNKSSHYVDPSHYTELENECAVKNIDITELMSAFLMCHVDDSTGERVYEYLHKTQMEYLAAGYLARGIWKRQITVADLENNFTLMRHHEVLKYMVGHLAILDEDDPGILTQNFATFSPIFTAADIKRTDFNYWWNIFVESKNHDSIGDAITSDRLPLNDWRLSEHEVMAGLELLSQTQVRLKTLKIDIRNVDPFSIKDFLLLMRNLKNRLKGRHEKKTAILVELHFLQHVNRNCPQKSDEFVKALYPWGHLEHFTGSHGEQNKGYELLKFCYNLKTIRVRVESAMALQSLAGGMKSIFKSVRNLRLTFAIPFECDLRNIVQLNLGYNVNFELYLLHIQDQHKEWVVNIVTALARDFGCRRLELMKSDVTVGGVRWLLQKLRGKVHEKLSVETINEPTDQQKEALKELEESVHIEVDWI